MPEEFNPSGCKSRDGTADKLSASFPSARQLSFLRSCSSTSTVNSLEPTLWTPIIQVLLQRQLGCVCMCESI